VRSADEHADPNVYTNADSNAHDTTDLHSNPDSDPLRRRPPAMLRVQYVQLGFVVVCGG